jgi:hypothetical protein
MEVEKTMAHQTNIVQKLELKLKEAEDAIHHHLVGSAPAGRSYPTTSGAPRSPVRTKRNIEREYNSQRYLPTPKPSSAKSRLRWDDGYVDPSGSEGSSSGGGGRWGGGGRYDDDETSRFGDLTFEDREISDEDEEIIPLSRERGGGRGGGARGGGGGPHKSMKRSSGNSKMDQRWVMPNSAAAASNSSSLQVVSILKEVLLNLMNRETKQETFPFKTKVSFPPSLLSARPYSTCSGKKRWRCSRSEGMESKT